MIYLILRLTEEQQDPKEPKEKENQEQENIKVKQVSHLMSPLRIRIQILEITIVI